MELTIEKESPESDKKYDKYELEEACNTLLKAKMIEKDEKMMAALKPYLDKKAKAAQEIAQIDPKGGLDGLKKVAKEKIAKDSKES